MEDAGRAAALLWCPVRSAGCATDLGGSDAAGGDRQPRRPCPRSAVVGRRRAAARSGPAAVQQPCAHGRRWHGGAPTAATSGRRSGPSASPSRSSSAASSRAAEKRPLRGSTLCAPRSRTHAARPAPTRQPVSTRWSPRERRVQLERRSTDMFDSVSQAVAKRRSAGEDTRLDANVAVVEAERSRNALAVATEQLLEARSELATTLQLPPGELPEVDAEPVDECKANAAPYTLDRAAGLGAVVAEAARAGRARGRSARAAGSRAGEPLSRMSRSG